MRRDRGGDGRRPGGRRGALQALGGHGRRRAHFRRVPHGPQVRRGVYRDPDRHGCKAHRRIN